MSSQITVGTIEKDDKIYLEQNAVLAWLYAYALDMKNNNKITEDERFATLATIDWIIKALSGEYTEAD